MFQLESNDGFYVWNSLGRIFMKLMQCCTVTSVIVSLILFSVSHAAGPKTSGSIKPPKNSCADFKEDYDQGLARLAKEKLERIKASLTFARDQHEESFKECVKKRDGCSEWEAKNLPKSIKRRKENIAVVNRALDSPISFGRTIIEELYDNGTSAGEATKLVRKFDTDQDFRKWNTKGGPGNYTRHEEWDNAETDLKNYVKDKISEAENCGISKRKFNREIAQMNVARPMAPLGWAFDFAKWWNAKPESSARYIDWAAQFVGTPRLGDDATPESVDTPKLLKIPREEKKESQGFFQGLRI
jgi:hypothetical protein